MQKTNLKWTQTSLKTLLILSAIVCLVLACYPTSANRQRRAVTWVESFDGGSVLYDYQFDAENFSYNSNGKLQTPEWLVNLAGVHFFAEVEHVHIDAPEIEGRIDLSLLASLKGLKSVHLSECNVSSLKPLLELPQLRNLILVGTPVEDVSLLAEIKSLRMLYLENTGIDDIEVLITSDNLEYFDVRENAVDQSQIRRLRKAFPMIR